MMVENIFPEEIILDILVFPEEIILEILAWLPVKSIGQFRCVNKSWYKFLSDESFVQKHLNYATQINRLSLKLYKFYNNNIYTINYDPSSSTTTSTGYVDRVPVDAYYETFDFIGYCNGLVCVRSHSHRFTVFLWNPTTKEFKDFPELCYISQLADIQFGFGYNGDYKVVKLVRRYGQPGSEVQVCKLGSDSWETLENIPYTVQSQRGIPQVLVNGVIYWEAYVYEGSEIVRKLILSFDFEKEIFQEMPWPNLLNETFESANLRVLGGSLCLCGFNQEIGLEVWEFGRVRKSWSQLFTVDVKKHFGFVIGMMPLQSLKNGEFLLGIDTDAGFHVHQYHPKHETSRLLIVYEDLVKYSPKYSSSTFVCVESLVSLKSYTSVDDEDFTDDDGDDDEDDCDDKYDGSSEVGDDTRNRNSDIR